MKGCSMLWKPRKDLPYGSKIRGILSDNSLHEYKRRKLLEQRKLDKQDKRQDIKDTQDKGGRGNDVLCSGC